VSSPGRWIPGSINLVAEIYVLAGEEFNVNSTKQLGHVLFDRLGLPPKKKTKTGYSTDAEVLESLANSHPIIQKVVDYREISKLKSTYVDALAQLVNAKTGRIHTSFNQTVTAYWPPFKRRSQLARTYRFVLKRDGE